MYKSLDQFVKDMELMFANAKAFNEDDSQVYKDAVMLQKELRSAAAIEKARTDEDLAGGGDGEGAVYNKNLRIPLDKIGHKGDTYRVGKEAPSTFYFYFYPFIYFSSFLFVYPLIAHSLPPISSRLSRRQQLTECRRLDPHCESKRPQQTHRGANLPHMERLGWPGMA